MALSNHQPAHTATSSAITSSCISLRAFYKRLRNLIAAASRSAARGRVRCETSKIVSLDEGCGRNVPAISAPIGRAARTPISTVVRRISQFWSDRCRAMRDIGSRRKMSCFSDAHPAAVPALPTTKHIALGPSGIRPGCSRNSEGRGAIRAEGGAARPRSRSALWRRGA